MTRECQVRICERLGVQFPGPTRQFPGPTRQAKAEHDATRCLQVEQEALDLSGINMRVATRPHVSDTSDTVL